MKGIVVRIKFKLNGDFLIKVYYYGYSSNSSVVFDVRKVCKLNWNVISLHAYIWYSKNRMRMFNGHNSCVFEPHKTKQLTFILTTTIYFNLSMYYYANYIIMNAATYSLSMNYYYYYYYYCHITFSPVNQLTKKTIYNTLFLLLFARELWLSCKVAGDVFSTYFFFKFSPSETRFN